MAFLGISIPPGISQLFRDVPCPGEKVGKGTYHITMIYIGDKTPLDVLCKTLGAVAPIMQRTPPLPLAVEEIDSFPSNPDWKAGLCPIIGKVVSPELHTLRAHLTRALDDNGVEFSKKFPEFKPHVSLAYAKERPKRMRLRRPIQWTAPETVLWAGDDDDDRFVVKFSLPRIGPRYESRVMKQIDDLRALIS